MLKQKKKKKTKKRIRQPKKSERQLKPYEVKNYTQDLIPIDEINNGLILMKDGRYIKILEIEPINFSLRSQKEQYDIILSFASLLKLPDLINFQFKAVTKKADPRRYIEMVKLKVDKEKNEKTEELANDYINLIRRLSSETALSRRFFMIFEYNSKTAGINKPSFPEILQRMNSIQAQAISFFAQCGNNIITYDDRTQNEDLYLLDILYTLLNRRSSINEPVESRYQHLVRDYRQAQGLNAYDTDPKIPIKDIIASRGMDFSNYNYTVIDGLYYTYLYIEGDGYPNMINYGFASGLANLGSGIDIDIHIKRQNKMRAIDNISRSLRLNKSSLRSTSSSSIEYNDLSQAITSADYLKAALQGGQDVFDFAILITVTSPTKKGLENKKESAMNILRTADISVRECLFNQKAATLATLPFNTIDKDLFNNAKHNATTYSLACVAYMFTAYEISDENGILLGVNQSNNSLCIIDPFNSKIYKNANMILIGTSGSGKTFTMQLQALRMRITGIQTFIIAPLKGYEFKRACDAIGGSYVRIGPSSPDAINIMQIRKQDKTQENIIDDFLSGEEESLLIKKTQQLNVFYQLLIPDLSFEEKALLDIATKKAYKKKGITKDNNSLYKEGSEEFKEMPILEDVYNELGDDENIQRVKTIFERYIKGSAANFNQQTNVDLDNKYVVLDISTLSKELLPIGMFIALDYCWDKVKEDRTKKKALFIDETWKLVNSDPLAANFVLEVFKIIRGYGGSAIAATQEMDDFYALEDGKYGKGIVNNSKIRIILNLENQQIDAIKDEFKLSDSEARSISHFRRGEALLSANNNKVPISIKPSPKELELITTDRDDLIKIAKKKKQERAFKNAE